MLTVDFARLGVQADDRVLDMGCGAGRHAFELARLGADVVAFDQDAAELAAVADMFTAMREAGEVPGSAGTQTVQGDALALPFPDGSFDRVVAAEVLEHIPADVDAIGELVRVLRPGGTLAVTVPSWLPERVCWALSDAYHQVEGGHVRIYSRSELVAKVTATGLHLDGSGHAHALHAPYWWLKCAVGVDDDDHVLVRRYHDLLVWDMMRRPWVTQTAERLLNPVIGKSLVLYFTKPLGADAPAPLRPRSRDADRVMVDVPSLPGVLTTDQVRATARSIARTQEVSGAIPWFPGGHVDPWDHVECAMALLVGGEVTAAARAWTWLLDTQRADGSWPRRVTDGVVDEPGVDANMCAYVAVGAWHHWLVRRDRMVVRRLWPSVRRALDLVVTMQLPFGGIGWALDADGRPDDQALLAGSASIHHALVCGLSLAAVVGDPQPDWELAVARLGHAIREHEDLFTAKTRFSMDWYYPILGGAVRGDAAHRRLDRRWEDFVVDGLGIRCVDDHPWVTGAETCELVCALAAVGRTDQARAVLADMQHLRDPDGSYWTGFVYPDQTRWPVEQSTWTAAAVILAVDVVSGTTPGSAIFAARMPGGGVAEFGLECGCGSGDRLTGVATHPGQ